MENLYNRNGLVFWNANEIKIRNMFEGYFTYHIMNSLRKQNSAFHAVMVEAPLLTPKNLINNNYTENDVFAFDDLVLRPETTMGSFECAKHLLSGYNDVKYRPPLVVWQHGKSFRREQDQPTKFMRLKEFYQLEMQAIFAANTANDYSAKLYPDVKAAVESMIGSCRLEESDRLPSYSEQTVDVVCEATGMEVCSMSKRNDLEGYRVIEIAIGTDRCVFNFLNKNTK
jgi:glycyl-tRNA synthetase